MPSTSIAASIAQSALDAANTALSPVPGLAPPTHFVLSLQLPATAPQAMSAAPAVAAQTAATTAADTRRRAAAATRARRGGQVRGQRNSRPDKGMRLRTSGDRRSGKDTPG